MTDDFKLSTQVFADILATVARSRSGDSDKRSATRVEVSARATVWWLGDDQRPLPASSVYLCDVSLTGVGFLTGRPVGAGEAFFLGIARHRREPVVLSCCALRAAELADGVYRVGASFVAQMAHGSRTPTLAA